MRDDLSRLRDILRAIDQIQKETHPGKTEFFESAKLQVWVLYHLQVIGEACRGLSPEFRNRRPDAAWSKAIGLRNILVHHYFEIDPTLVWQVVEQDLTALRSTVESCLKFFTVD